MLAFEAIQDGITITLAPNAASFLSEKELKNIKNLILQMMTR